MTATQTQNTHLRAAEAELEIANGEVARIAKDIQPLEERHGALHEALENATQTGGSGSADAKRATAGLAAIAKDVMGGRQRLLLAQRRRDRMAERVESERRAVALTEQAVRDQEARVARQSDVVTTKHADAHRSAQVLEAEERRLVDLRRDLAVLIGEDV